MRWPHARRKGRKKEPTEETRTKKRRRETYQGGAEKALRIVPAISTSTSSATFSPWRPVWDGNVRLAMTSPGMLRLEAMDAHAAPFRELGPSGTGGIRSDSMLDCGCGGR